MKGTLLLMLAGVTVLGTVSGCKGTVEVRPDPKVAEDLRACQVREEENKKLIASYEAEIRRNSEGAAAGGEVVVRFENDVLTIKPAAPGGEPPIDPKVAQAQSKHFVDVVTKSRGAIQKCYEQALKKDSGLAASTITLNISAVFSAAGQFQSLSFSRSLGGTFDACVRGVAAKWQIPATARAMTFKAPVSLTPS